MSQNPQFSALRRRDEFAIEQIRDQLRSRGFACVQMDETKPAQHLSAALDDAAQLEGFRFPPIDSGQPNYTPPRRAVFESLFHIATECLAALFDGEELPPNILSAIEAVRAHPPSLFRSVAHEPFESGQPFGQSFFNLFNYNRGLLNSHADRSLLTVIKVNPGQNLSQQTALWVQDPNGTWTNADETVQINEVILLVGEDSEKLSAAKRLGLYAAAHSVRVHPTGEYLSHSHFRPDPDTPSDANRTSTAFILRHDPIPIDLPTQMK